MAEHFDVAVVGMGPGGELATSRLLEAGRTVVAIEQELIGGECGYWACIPTKTLLRPVELSLLAAATPGVATGPLDWEAVRSWRDDMVRHFDDAKQVTGYEEQGATVVRGTARFTGPGRIEVAGRTITADHVILATGSTPFTPDIDGLDEVTTWTNREATALAEVPGRVLVVGASAVAVETSQYLRAYGAEVTVIGRGPRVLGREELRLSELVAQHLAHRGIRFELGTAPVRAFRAGEESRLELDNGRVVAGDVVLLATGRRANTGGLGLGAAGVEVDERGAVRVDENCSAGPGVWAVGDVTGIMQFTHVAKHQARAVVGAILGRPRPTNYDHVPRVVFGHPEIAAVGLTAEQAREQGHQVRTAEVDLAAALARPWTQERDPGGLALGLVADEESRTLLGAWAVAPQASEWIHQAALAIGAEIPIERLLDQVPQFPTYSEGYLLALEDLHL